MIQTFIEMLQFPFIQRALLVGVLTGVMCALLGVSLVLKNYSMIGDGLSHVGFGAFTIAIACGFSPLGFAIPCVIFCAFLMLRMNKRSTLHPDAMIALLSSSALAAGIIVTSLTKGMNTDIYQFMFGSILASGKSEVTLSVVMCALVMLAYLLLYHKIFAVTFDEVFCRAVGVPVERYTLLVSILTAIVIVIGMRIMGAMLISSMILFPALTALMLFRSFKACLVASGLIAACTVVTGITLSYAYSFPTGAIIVMVNLLLWLIVRGWRFLRGLGR